MSRATPDRSRLLAPFAPVALASAALQSRPARAQEAWPTKAVTIIVPQAAGGANDTPPGRSAHGCRRRSASRW